METYETMPQGDSAVCGRRVSFWMSRKKPMAQATFSWPFGPIHLERHQGAAQDERSALIFAAPGPHYGGRPPERLCRVSGAQNLSDLPQFNPGPLGPCVCKNFRFCHSTTAPEFAEPTARFVGGRAAIISHPNFRFRARSTGKMLPIRTSV